MEWTGYGENEKTWILRRVTRFGRWQWYRKLSEAFYKACDIDIPREYVEFLRQCNGVEFNGCIIYGSNNIIENQLDYDYIAEDYIIFAEYDMGWFCMEKFSGKYCELDKPSAQEMQMFETLESMLKRVLLLSVEL